MHGVSMTNDGIAVFRVLDLRGVLGGGLPRASKGFQPLLEVRRGCQPGFCYHGVYLYIAITHGGWLGESGKARRSKRLRGTEP